MSLHVPRAHQLPIAAVAAASALFLAGCVGVDAAASDSGRPSSSPTTSEASAAKVPTR
jgi:PBP1b-binding outer membrane lipoprotein LpoB